MRPPTPTPHLPQLCCMGPLAHLGSVCFSGRRIPGSPGSCCPLLRTVAPPRARSGCPEPQAAEARASHPLGLPFSKAQFLPSGFVRCRSGLQGGAEVCLPSLWKPPAHRVRSSGRGGVVGPGERTGSPAIAGSSSICLNSPFGLEQSPPWKAADPGRKHCPADPKFKGFPLTHPTS